MADNVAKFGLTALPADQSKQPPENANPKPVSVDFLQPPATPLAARIDAYTRSVLPAATYRHSLRVYAYGCAIARECYPSFGLVPGSALDETWFCTAMLHDLGTTPEHIGATRLSYEFWAGYRALEVLQDASVDVRARAAKDQAESICEAVIRHQDVQEKGMLTLLTRLIHWGTLLDNIGAVRELVHRETIVGVNAEWDRKGWCGCFKATVAEEKRLKPYAMVSRIEGFEETIERNGQRGLMSEWD